MKVKKVIVIDDSSTVRTKPREWLATETVDVLEEENGLLGYEKIKSMEKELDLIIVDINMPGLDGIICKNA